MKVLATVDYIDGSESRTKLVHLDELNTMYLRLKLVEPGVASITITRADLLSMLKKTNIGC